MENIEKRHASCYVRENIVFMSKFYKIVEHTRKIFTFQGTQHRIENVTQLQTFIKRIKEGDFLWNFWVMHNENRLEGKRHTKSVKKWSIDDIIIISFVWLIFYENKMRLSLIITSDLNV